MQIIKKKIQGINIEIRRDEDYMRITQLDKNDKEIFGAHVELYNGRDYNKTISKWKIGWGSPGSQSIEFVKGYVVLFQEAIKIAEALNKNK